MPRCYLTIDDSPSPHTDGITAFLIKRNIPALLFARGDLIEANPEPIVRAIENGFIIGNHSYSHCPFGDLNYDEAVKDIEQCEELINDCYQIAGIERHGKYFRFPYLDRGNGDRIERHFDNVTNIDINNDNSVHKLQIYLKEHGFTQPFKTNHPIYNNPSIANASDCLMTFTSYDWMMTNRHKGKWDYKNIDDLKQRLDDSDMKNHDGNITIFHDQSETFETFKTLIDYMIDKGYDFISINT